MSREFEALKTSLTFKFALLLFLLMRLFKYESLVYFIKVAADVFNDRDSSLPAN